MRRLHRRPKGGPADHKVRLHLVTGQVREKGNANEKEKGKNVLEGAAAL